MPDKSRILDKSRIHYNKIKCGYLNENTPHWFINLNARSPGSDTLKEWEGVVLTEAWVTEGGP